MFKTSIASTPLTTDAANSFFQNISGQKFGGDNSFLATLRALVAPRIKEGERIYLKFGRSDYNTSTIDSVPVGRVVNAICSSHDLNDAAGCIVVHNLASNQEGNIANLKAIEAGFTSCYDGYHRLEKVKEFYRKSFHVDCYINPELKNTIIFVDNLDNKKLHYLQVSILAFLPWYFDPSVGVSETEMELIYSMRETCSEKYERCIARIAEQYDFKKARIRQLLNGFEMRYERNECDRIRDELNAITSEINRLNHQIGSMFGERNNACIKLMGLEQKIAEGGEDSEIMEYFLCNERLYLENVTETDMYFAVKDYLSYFDTDMAERIIKNRRGLVYNQLGNRETYHGISADQMQKLLLALFTEDSPRLRVKVCAAYRFALNGNVGTQGDHGFSYEFYDCMPNPHIDRYNCIGNYQRTINDLLISRNYIGALEQCVASCKSLNWGDSTVMSTFMETMWGRGGYNNRCIELSDGRVVEPAEAVRWLEQQEANTIEQTEETQQDE